MVEVLLIDVRQATPVKARVRAVDSGPFILISAEHMLRLQRLSSSLPKRFSYNASIYNTGGLSGVPPRPPSQHCSIAAALAVPDRIRLSQWSSSQFAYCTLHPIDSNSNTDTQQGQSVSIKRRLIRVTSHRSRLSLQSLHCPIVVFDTPHSQAHHPLLSNAALPSSPCVDRSE